MKLSGLAEQEMMLQEKPLIKQDGFLNLPYPAGPLIEKLASTANKRHLSFSKTIIGQMISTFLFPVLKQQFYAKC